MTYEIMLDLSKISEEGIAELAETGGLPGRVADQVSMLRDLQSSGLQPVDGADLSKEWTVPTSLRTARRINSILESQ